MDNKITPFFSVIMPCYNSAHYVENTIRQILGQSFDDFELIIVDDGSTDNTFQIINKLALKDQRLKLFRQPNTGAASARNLGIQKAKGCWITFCDSDDQVGIHWLKSFHDNIKTNADLLSQGFKFNEGQSATLPYREYEWHDIRFWLEQSYHAFLWGFIWCKAFRKSIIEANHLAFSPQLSFQEDLEFVLHYIECCKKIVQIDSAEYVYITNGNNSKYRNYRKMDGAILCINHLKTIIPNYDGVLIGYFQRLMMEDIYIGYRLHDSRSKRLSNIKKFRQAVSNKLYWKNCLGFSRKLFYALYSHFSISFIDKVLLLLFKIHVFKN